MSVKSIPPDPLDDKSLAGAHCVPLHLSTCPALGVELETSVSPPNVLDPPPDAVVKLKLPEPSVVKTCPLVPSVIDKSVMSVGIVGVPVSDAYAPSNSTGGM